MNKLFFLVVCCLLCLFCQAANTKRWGKKKGGKHRWSMEGFTNVTWTSLISGAQVSERAIYKDSLNVIFMFSRDDSITMPYRKSFFIYDVDANLGAISVKQDGRKYCFITAMDESKTIELVKGDLSSLNNTEATSAKPTRTLYVSTSDSKTVEELLPRSNMISAICSKAANCNNAYMVSTEPREDIEQYPKQWKTSSLYHLNNINLSFDPSTQQSECRSWTNYWSRRSRGRNSRRQ